MTVGEVDGKIFDKDSYITITNAERSSTNREEYFIQKGATRSTDVDDWDVDFSNSIDVVSSYTLEGGPETPFEMATLKISRKKLMTYIPSLTQADAIVAGRNKIQIHGIGDASLIVTKCKLTNNTYTITAYCEAEKIRSYVAETDISGHPYDIIKQILTSGTYGVQFTESRIISNCSSSSSGDEVSVIFKQGTNIWVILQLCAMYLNAKIFFANNRTYVIDYTVLNEYKGLYFEDPTEDNGSLELYSTEVSKPFCGSVAEDITLGSEGIDTIINRITIQYLDEDGKTTQHIQDSTVIKRSISMYGEVNYILDIGQYMRNSPYIETFARKVAAYVENYRAEPQQSIKFQVKERSMVNDEIYWSPMFPIVTAVKGFKSQMDDIEITNHSELDNTDKPQRLALSTYVRNYPKGTSEYTFGIANNVDLSQSTSEIRTRTG